MTDNVNIVNRALQILGTRTTVDAAELLAESSNEAIQANLILTKFRDQLLRLAPWDCAMATANMNLISAVPGTPENSSPATNLWAPGQPPPPWTYEYQYPVDCLRACWIIPAQLTGFAGSIPITTAITGGAPAYWSGQPIPFKVQIDQFVPVTAAAIAAGGVGHAVGDEITLASGPTTSPPIGAPAKLTVATVGGGGAIATVTVVAQVEGSSPAQGGSYFARQTNPVAQGSTTGSGTGATFNLTYGTKGSQRVILTNQEYATLSYIKQVTDPNVMDPMFVEAWACAVGSRLAVPLTGDKSLTKMCIDLCNEKIIEARKVDGNEGLTQNNVTPDWLRVRGIYADDGISGPYSSYDWGGLWMGY